MFKIISMHEVIINSVPPAVVRINKSNKTSPINFHKCNQDTLLKQWKEMVLKIRLVMSHN